MKTIILQETRQGCAPFEKEPRYNVMFKGELFDQLYFNMTGYVGYLPTPKEDGSAGKLSIGEKGIGAYRKEVSQLNKEWASMSVAYDRGWCQIEFTEEITFEAASPFKIGDYNAKKGSKVKVEIIEDKGENVVVQFSSGQCATLPKSCFRRLR